MDDRGISKWTYQWTVGERRIHTCLPSRGIKCLYRLDQNGNGTDWSGVTLSLPIRSGVESSDGVHGNHPIHAVVIATVLIEVAEELRARLLEATTLTVQSSLLCSSACRTREQCFKIRDGRCLKDLIKGFLVNGYYKISSLGVSLKCLTSRMQTFTEYIVSILN